MLSFSVPPGYRRTAPIRRPKLDGFTEIIDQWLRDRLEADHSAPFAIFEHGSTGGNTDVTRHLRSPYRPLIVLFLGFFRPRSRWGARNFLWSRSVREVAPARQLPICYLSLRHQSTRSHKTLILW
jgi:hypothetical protein